jgi:hypothetical protein
MVYIAHSRRICVVELKKTIQEHLMNGSMVLFSCSDKDRPAPWLLFLLSDLNERPPLFLLLLQIEVIFLWAFNAA